MEKSYWKLHGIVRIPGILCILLFKSYLEIVCFCPCRWHKRSFLTTTAASAHPSTRTRILTWWSEQLGSCERPRHSRQSTWTYSDHSTRQFVLNNNRSVSYLTFPTRHCSSPSCACPGPAGPRSSFPPDYLIDGRTECAELNNVPHKSINH